MAVYTAAMKTLLVIGYVWPEPNSTAAGSRMLQILHCFKQAAYSITFASPAMDSPHAVDLPLLDITVQKIALNCSSFDAFLTQLQPDIVLFDRFMMEEQFAWRVEKVCPQALRILDTEDLHCLRYARQQLAKKDNCKVICDVPAEALFNEQAIREVAAILRCDLSLMISEYEMQLLTKTFSVADNLLMYLPYMLDAKALKQASMSPSFEQREDFISIGNFRHEPNWDAVLTLKQYIWPQIRKSLPKAKLHIYGAYPPKKATQLHNEKQGFLIKGWVEDAESVMLNGRVLLAPVRFGAGLKGKFIDAARAGLPSVTTSVGIEGLFGDEAAAAKTAIACDDFNDFAEQAVQLYSVPSHWQTLHAQCPEFLRQRFDAAQFSPALIQQVERLMAQLSEHRLNNFTGRMLRHHSMKSTQYMSQWIEAKNRLLER